MLETFHTERSLLVTSYLWQNSQK